MWYTINNDKRNGRGRYVCQFKIPFHNSGTYRNTSRDFMKGKERKYCTYCQKYGHAIEEYFRKNRYDQECTYCH